MGVIARQSSLNAIYITIGVVIGAISNVFLYPYFFRNNLDYLGFLQLFVTTSALFVPFLTFGSVGIAVRYYSKMIKEGRENLLSFYCWTLPFFGIVIFLFILIFFGNNIISFFFKKNYVSDNLFIWGLFLLTFFMTFFRSLSAMNIARIKTDFVIFLNDVYIRLILLIGLFLVILDLITLKDFFVFHIIAYFSQLLILLIVYRNETFFSFEIPTFQEFKETIIYGIFSVFDNVASLVVNKMDIFMIAFYLTLDKVAIYNFAFFMSIVINVPNRALMIVATPVIARSVHDNDFENVSKIYQKSSLTQLLLGGIIFILIWINFNNIIRIAHLPLVFKEAEYVFFFLGVSKLIDLIGSVNGSILLATSYFKYNLYFNVLLLAITIILNILFIPTFGIEGAAIATAISLLLFNILKGAFLYIKYRMQPFHPNTLKGFLILFISWAINYFIPEMNNVWLDIFIRMSVTSILFFPAIIYFQISEDINDMFYKLVRRFFK